MNLALNVGGLVMIGLGVATYSIPIIPIEILILVGLVVIGVAGLSYWAWPDIADQ